VPTAFGSAWPDNVVVPEAGKFKTYDPRQHNLYARTMKDCAVSHSEHGTRLADKQSEQWSAQ
jgi:hypothetical protein